MKKNKQATILLVGLPGLGRSRAALATTPSEAVRLTTSYRSVSASGGSGAINILRRRNGELWCEFMSNLHSVSRMQVTKNGLRNWLATWWPELCRD